MSGTSAPGPMATHRRGTAWIAEDVFALEQPVFWGYWDAEPDAPPALLEEMPDTRYVDTAIAWGRKRAGRPPPPAS